ncbi:threonine dehydratase I [Nadsonia fulvescens var. elongata DSM 6958]|uniref:Threonine dehydratase n=1 Tax=Nadsonia fulvescens var. elongata DSM 6958 TaxID=857566 RepID=A0A1E3PK31_9ASCO|nr:threonine dehydratase I [Nadsonia fulvescens var. elongata DSM 6958]
MPLRQTYRASRSLVLTASSTLRSNRLPNSTNAFYSTAKTANANPMYANVDPAYMLEDGTPDYLRMILTSRVYDVCKETPLTDAVSLSVKAGANIQLKREDLQPVFSFKLRGAYNMIAHLPPKLRKKGVIACSAGNHAQGVAYSAKYLNIPATIVMPVVTPAIKYKNVARLGSNVVLYGNDFDSAKKECARLSAEESLHNIPPFDDPYVIAGQGTIGMEILRQTDVSKLKAVFCAVGGGGLIAGIGAYIKRIAPHVKVIGVETFDADAMRQSLKERERVTLNDVGLFADGTAVRIVGEETFRLSQEYVDDIVRVSTDEICTAIKDVFEDTRSIVEPSGALSVAGVKRYVADRPNEDHTTASYTAVLSGANINFDRLRFVSERSRLEEGGEVFMNFTIPEKPGSFNQLYKFIQPRDVTEFSYRYCPSQGSAGIAKIYCSFNVKDRKKEIPSIISSLENNQMSGEDISDNELAKSHARYLIGGRADIADERIFCFELPERPGALGKFLQGIESKWNITLFHYRNHGSDIGKVLAGLSVPSQDSEKFDEFLSQLQYPFVEETSNPVYQQFMKS